MIYAEGSDTQIGVAFGVGFGVAFGVTTPNRGCVWFCGPDRGQINAFKPRDRDWEPEIEVATPNPTRKVPNLIIR